MDESVTVWLERHAIIGPFAEPNYGRTSHPDFSTAGLTAPEIPALVAAWPAGAVSQDTILDLFRCGEVLLECGSNAEAMVSNDRDLLALERPFGAAILTPVEFLKRVRGRLEP